MKRIRGAAVSIAEALDRPGRRAWVHGCDHCGLDCAVLVVARKVGGRDVGLFPSGVVAGTHGGDKRISHEA